MTALLMGLVVPRMEAHTYLTLDPKADAGKCIQCHADKTKGAFVHAAMAKGCLSCHEVRVTNDVTRVRLTTTSPLALCLTCHADKNAATIKGSVHSPAVRDCLKCHDPHRSENKNLLVKATAGATPQQNLCLTCHNTGVDVPAGGSRHAALDKGCETCHVTHKWAIPLSANSRFTLPRTRRSYALVATMPRMRRWSRPIRGNRWRRRTA